MILLANNQTDRSTENESREIATSHLRQAVRQETKKLKGQPGNNRHWPAPRTPMQSRRRHAATETLDMYAASTTMMNCILNTTISCVVGEKTESRLYA